MAQCLLANHYQFFRDLLACLDAEGSYLLISDARSPAFACDSLDGHAPARGVLSLLRALVPAPLRARIGQIRVQQLLAALEATNRHGDWLGDFRQKYAL
jgi:hypothetical protein